MRVLLVNTNREILPQPVIPVGVCCVASSLQRRGIETRVVDLCFTGDPLAVLSRAVASYGPDCVGLSIRNIDNSDRQGSRFYLQDIKPLVASIRQLTAAPIILGGSAVSIAPWPVLDYLGCDIAVTGDGETALGDVVTALSEGRLPAGHEVTCRPDGKLVFEASRCGLAEERLPPPRVQRWLDLSPYRSYRVPLPVQSKRGCVFDCSYCTYRAIEGSGYRLKPPRQVAEEIAEMRREVDYSFFELVDSTFNHPESHAFAVCEALTRLDGGLKLQGSVNPADCSHELFGTMRRAGFNSLVCTPDSAADEMLHRLGKGFTSRELSRMVDLVHAVDIPVLWCFLFGGPGETEETVRETLAFIEKRLTRRDVVFLSAGVRVYPGTRLAETAAQEGVIDPQGDLLEPVFYFSPLLSPERFADLIRDHLSRCRGYMLSSDLRLGFLLKMQRAASLLRLKTPLWQYAPLINRVWPRRWLREGITETKRVGSHSEA